jgi:Helix-turn-helix
LGLDFDGLDGKTTVSDWSHSSEPFSQPGKTPLLRIERGLKQTELSLAAGLTWNLVYLWEWEFRRPRKRSLERMAAVLGVSVEYLRA